MRNHSFRKLILSCLALCLFAVAVLAQDYNSLLGKWNMTSETDSDPVNWTLVLKEEEGKLKAFLTTDDGEQATKNFTYKDGVIRFEAPYQGEYYEVELKAKDNKLDGTWSGGGNSGRTTGVKEPGQ